MVHLPQTIFFWKKIIKIILIYQLAPFILQNFKKVLKANPDLRGCSTRSPKIPQFVLNKFFGYKPLLLLSSTYWYFSLGKILKKFLQRIHSYEDAQFLGQKWSIFTNFFRKPVNEPCFFHSCLSTCKKSKSDIYLLVKYQRLKNTEISLAKNNFWL